MDYRSHHLPPSTSSSSSSSGAGSSGGHRPHASPHHRSLSAGSTQDDFTGCFSASGGYPFSLPTSSRPPYGGPHPHPVGAPEHPGYSHAPQYGGWQTQRPEPHTPHPLESFRFRQRSQAHQAPVSSRPSQPQAREPEAAMADSRRVSALGYSDSLSHGDYQPYPDTSRRPQFPHHDLEGVPDGHRHPDPSVYRQPYPYMGHTQPPTNYRSSGSYRPPDEELIDLTCGSPQPQASNSHQPQAYWDTRHEPRGFGQDQVSSHPPQPLMAYERLSYPKQSNWPPPGDSRMVQPTDQRPRDDTYRSGPAESTASSLFKVTPPSAQSRGGRRDLERVEKFVPQNPELEPSSSQHEILTFKQPEASVGHKHYAPITRSDGAILEHRPPSRASHPVQMPPQDQASEGRRRHERSRSDHDRVYMTQQSQEPVQPAQPSTSRKQQRSVSLQPQVYAHAHQAAQPSATQSQKATRQQPEQSRLPPGEIVGYAELHPSDGSPFPSAGGQLPVPGSEQETQSTPRSESSSSHEVNPFMPTPPSAQMRGGQCEQKRFDELDSQPQASSSLRHDQLERPRSEKSNQGDYGAPSESNQGDNDPPSNQAYSNYSPLETNQGDSGSPSEPSQGDNLGLPSESNQVDGYMPPEPSQVDNGMPPEPSQVDNGMPSEPSQSDIGSLSEPRQWGRDRFAEHVAEHFIQTLAEFAVPKTLKSKENDKAKKAKPPSSSVKKVHIHFMDNHSDPSVPYKLNCLKNSSDLWVYMPTMKTMIELLYGRLLHSKNPSKEKASEDSRTDGNAKQRGVPNKNNKQEARKSSGKQAVDNNAGQPAPGPSSRQQVLGDAENEYFWARIRLGIEILEQGDDDEDAFHYREALEWRQKMEKPTTRSSRSKEEVVTAIKMESIIARKTFRGEEKNSDPRPVKAQVVSPPTGPADRRDLSEERQPVQQLSDEKQPLEEPEENQCPVKQQTPSQSSKSEQDQADTSNVDQRMQQARPGEAPGCSAPQQICQPQDQGNQSTDTTTEMAKPALVARFIRKSVSDRDSRKKKRWAVTVSPIHPSGTSPSRTISPSPLATEVSALATMANILDSPLRKTDSPLTKSDSQMSTVSPSINMAGPSTNTAVPSTSEAGGTSDGESSHTGGGSESISSQGEGASGSGQSVSKDEAGGRQGKAETCLLSSSSTMDTGGEENDETFYSAFEIPEVDASSTFRRLSENADSQCDVSTSDVSFKSARDARERSRSHTSFKASAVSEKECPATSASGSEPLQRDSSPLTLKSPSHDVSHNAASVAHRSQSAPERSSGAKGRQSSKGPQKRTSRRRSNSASPPNPKKCKHHAGSSGARGKCTGGSAVCKQGSVKSGSSLWRSWEESDSWDSLQRDDPQSQSPRRQSQAMSPQPHDRPQSTSQDQQKAKPGKSRPLSKSQSKSPDLQSKSQPKSAECQPKPESPDRQPETDTSPTRDSQEDESPQTSARTKGIAPEGTPADRQPGPAVQPTAEAASPREPRAETSRADQEDPRAVQGGSGEIQVGSRDVLWGQQGGRLNDTSSSDKSEEIGRYVRDFFRRTAPEIEAGQMSLEPLAVTQPLMSLPKLLPVCESLQENIFSDSSDDVQMCSVGLTPFVPTPPSAQSRGGRREHTGAADESRPGEGPCERHEDVIKPDATSHEHRDEDNDGFSAQSGQSPYDAKMLSPDSHKDVNESDAGMANEAPSVGYVGQEPVTPDAATGLQSVGASSLFSNEPASPGLQETDTVATSAAETSAGPSERSDVAQSSCADLVPAEFGQRPLWARPTSTVTEAAFAGTDMPAQNQLSTGSPSALPLPAESLQQHATDALTAQDSEPSPGLAQESQDHVGAAPSGLALSCSHRPPRIRAEGGVSKKGPIASTPATGHNLPHGHMSLKIAHDFSQLHDAGKLMFRSHSVPVHIEHMDTSIGTQSKPLLKRGSRLRSSSESPTRAKRLRQWSGDSSGATHSQSEDIHRSQHDHEKHRYQTTIPNPPHFGHSSGHLEMSSSPAVDSEDPAPGNSSPVVQVPQASLASQDIMPHLSVVRQNSADLQTVDLAALVSLTPVSVDHTDPCPERDIGDVQMSSWAESSAAQNESEGQSSKELESEGSDTNIHTSTPRQDNQADKSCNSPRYSDISMDTSYPDRDDSPRYSHEASQVYGSFATVGQVTPGLGHQPVRSTGLEAPSTSMFNPFMLTPPSTQLRGGRSWPEGNRLGEDVSRTPSVPVMDSLQSKECEGGRMADQNTLPQVTTAASTNSQNSGQTPFTLTPPSAQLRGGRRERESVSVPDSQELAQETNEPSTGLEEMADSSAVPSVSDTPAAYIAPATASASTENQGPQTESADNTTLLPRVPQAQPSELPSLPQAAQDSKLQQAATDVTEASSSSDQQEDILSLAYKEAINPENEHDFSEADIDTTEPSAEVWAYPKLPGPSSTGTELLLQVPQDQMHGLVSAFETHHGSPTEEDMQDSLTHDSCQAEPAKLEGQAASSNSQNSGQTPFTPTPPSAHLRGGRYERESVPVPDNQELEQETNEPSTAGERNQDDQQEEQDDELSAAVESLQQSQAAQPKEHAAQPCSQDSFQGSLIKLPESQDITQAYEHETLSAVQNLVQEEEKHELLKMFENHHDSIGEEGYNTASERQENSPSPQLITGNPVETAPRAETWQAPDHLEHIAALEKALEDFEVSTQSSQDETSVQQEDNSSDTEPLKDLPADFEGTVSPHTEFDAAVPGQSAEVPSLKNKAGSVMEDQHNTVAHQSDTGNNAFMHTLPSAQLRGGQWVHESVKATEMFPLQSAGVQQSGTHTNINTWPQSQEIPTAAEATESWTWSSAFDQLCLPDYVSGDDQAACSSLSQGLATHLSGTTTSQQSRDGGGSYSSSQTAQAGSFTNSSTAPAPWATDSFVSEAVVSGLVPDARAMDPTGDGADPGPSSAGHAWPAGVPSSGKSGESAEPKAKGKKGSGNQKSAQSLRKTTLASENAQTGAEANTKGKAGERGKGRGKGSASRSKKGVGSGKGADHPDNITDFDLFPLTAPSGHMRGGCGERKKVKSSAPGAEKGPGSRTSTEGKKNSGKNKSSASDSKKGKGAGKSTAASDSMDMTEGRSTPIIEDSGLGMDTPGSAHNQGCLLPETQYSPLTPQFPQTQRPPSGHGGTLSFTASPTVAMSVPAAADAQQHPISCSAFLSEQPATTPKINVRIHAGSSAQPPKKSPARKPKKTGAAQPTRTPAPKQQPEKTATTAKPSDNMIEVRADDRKANVFEMSQNMDIKQKPQKAAPKKKSKKKEEVEQAQSQPTPWIDTLLSGSSVAQTAQHASAYAPQGSVQGLESNAMTSSSPQISSDPASAPQPSNLHNIFPAGTSVSHTQVPENTPPLPIPAIPAFMPGTTSTETSTASPNRYPAQPSVYQPNLNPFNLTMPSAQLRGGHCENKSVNPFSLGMSAAQFQQSQAISSPQFSVKVTPPSPNLTFNPTAPYVQFPLNPPASSFQLSAGHSGSGWVHMPQTNANVQNVQQVMLQDAQGNFVPYFLAGGAGVPWSGPPSIQGAQFLPATAQSSAAAPAAIQQQNVVNFRSTQRNQ